MKLQLPEHIASLRPQLSDRTTDKKGTIERSPVTNLAFNENPWGPSPMVVRALRSILTNQHHYPVDADLHLRKRLAEKANLSSDEVLLGSGIHDILELLFTCFVDEGKEVILSQPCFRMNHPHTLIHGSDSFSIPMKNYQHDLESILVCTTEHTRLIILDNPNNPTGSPINPGELYSFLSTLPETVVVVLDESYVDFMDSEFQVDVYSLIRNNKGRCGVVVLRSFSHAYGLAGLRIGYGLMAEKISEILQTIQRPYPVNQMAMVGAQAALDDDTYHQKTLALVQKEREVLRAGIEKIGCRVYPSQANFLLVDTERDGASLVSSMLQRDVAVASMAALDLPSCFRVSVGTEKDNQHFLDIFTSVYMM